MTPVSGGTLLHLAIEYDDIDVARWLIERGADVNANAAIDADGFGGHTPLFHTVVNLASGMGRTTTQRRGSSSTMAPIPTPGRPSRRRPSSTTSPPPTRFTA